MFAAVGGVDRLSAESAYEEDGLTTCDNSMLKAIRSCLWRTPWLFAWIVACVIAVPLLSFRTQSELIGCYLPAANRVAEGLALPGSTTWVYPPFFTITVLPLVPIPLVAARMLWSAMLITCSVVAVRFVWNTLMLDSRFRSAVCNPRLFFLFVGALALGAAGHVATPLSYQAHDIWVLVLITAGAWCYARALIEPTEVATRWDTKVGVCFGLAASFKVMPVLFLPVLLAQRRWRAAFAMALTGVAAAVSFDLLAIALTGQHHFAAWVELARAGSDLTQSGGGRWPPWNPLNQSGTGILSRLLTPTPPALGLNFECMVIAVGSEGQRMLLSAWIATLVSALLLVVGLSRRAYGLAYGTPQVSAAIYALAVAGATSCVYLLIAPHSSNYHFAPVGLAVAASLAWIITRGVDTTVVVCLALMVLMELIPGRDVLGNRWRDILLACGLIGACALLGFISCSRICILAARECRAGVGCSAGAASPQ